jgi:hypothetical protein
MNMLLEVNGVPNRIHSVKPQHHGWTELLVAPVGFDQPVAGITVPTWWYNRRQESPGSIVTSGQRLQWVEEAP